MERTKKKAEDRPKWRKVGGGSLRIGGRIIKPNQVFHAHEDEIPGAFRGSLELVEGNLVVTPKPAEAEDLKPKKLFAVKKGNKSKEWDVVNIDSGKAINDEPFATKAEAEGLLKTLQ